MGTSVIRASAARIVGRSHLATASVCQDAVAARIQRDAACIAVADGAGSRKRSDVGARIATDRVIDVVLGDFERLFRLVSEDVVRAKRALLFPVLQSLRRKNKRKKEPVDSMACTLLFVAYKDGRFLAGHIGDGIIAVRNGPTSSVLSMPEQGEFLNTTVFVTDKDAVAHVRLYAGEASRGFGAMLMTDGTAESLYDRPNKTLAPAVDKFFDWSTRLPNEKMKAVLLANLEQVLSKKTTDDCSIAVLAVT